MSSFCCPVLVTNKCEHTFYHVQSFFNTGDEDAGVDVADAEEMQLRHSLILTNDLGASPGFSLLFKRQMTTVKSQSLA